MSLVSSALFAAILTASGPLRVCADPNNLPYSNAQGAGFENKIAALVAEALRRPLVYVWHPARRGFIRETLNAGLCDVVMSVPGGFESARPTVPYYRSTYVFVSRRERARVTSLDDPRLRSMRIGIQITGNDYSNPPAAEALARRHLASNVRGFTVYGNYADAEPQRPVLDAVLHGDVETAIVWGPLAGFFARGPSPPLLITPVTPSHDGPALPFVFDIAMATRRGDTTLHDALNKVITCRRAAIRRILRGYGVPLV